MYAIFKKCIFKSPKPFLVAITLQLCALPLYCLGQGTVKDTPNPSPVIYATANQQLLSLENLINRIHQAHVTILGELHDNPYHHELRANLLRQLPKRSVTIIAEHLPAKKTVQWNLNLEADLKNAGFDLKAFKSNPAFFKSASRLRFHCTVFFAGRCSAMIVTDLFGNCRSKFARSS